MEPLNWLVRWAAKKVECFENSGPSGRSHIAWKHPLVILPSPEDKGGRANCNKGWCCVASRFLFSVYAPSPEKPESPKPRHLLKATKFSPSRLWLCLAFPTREKNPEQRSRKRDKRKKRSKRERVSCKLTGPLRDFPHQMSRQLVTPITRQTFPPFSSHTHTHTYTRICNDIYTNVYFSIGKCVRQLYLYKKWQ